VLNQSLMEGLYLAGSSQSEFDRIQAFVCDKILEGATPAEVIQFLRVTIVCLEEMQNTINDAEVAL